MGYFPNVKRGYEAGLTLMEILVVVALIGLIVVMIFPVRHVSWENVSRIMCLNNVKQIALGVVSYAIDNGNRLPEAPTGPGHSPWDVPWEPFEVLQKSGVTRDIMYDRAFRQQNDDRLWNAATNSYRVIGYALTLPGTGSTVIASNQNATFPDNLTQPKQSRAGQVDASLRVLVADPIISLPGQNDPTMVASYQWKNIPGGLPDSTKTTNGTWHGFSTSHLDKAGRLPLGGNLGMLDGHAHWQPFNGIQQPRTTGTNGTAVFWW